MPRRFGNDGKLATSGKHRKIGRNIRRSVRKGRAEYRKMEWSLRRWCVFSLLLKEWTELASQTCDLRSCDCVCKETVKTTFKQNPEISQLYKKCSHGLSCCHRYRYKIALKLMTSTSLSCWHLQTTSLLFARPICDKYWFSIHFFLAVFCLFQFCSIPQKRWPVKGALCFFISWGDLEF